MENFVPIKFQLPRDFGSKVSSTFEFARQNFKPLGKALLYIAGPPALIGSMVLGNFMGDFMSQMTNVADPQAMLAYYTTISFWLQVLLMFVFGVLAYVFTIATIYNYILIYEERQSNQVDVSEVWERVRSTFTMYLGTILLFGVLLLVLYIIVLIPIFLIATVAPVLVVFLVLALLVGFAYVLVAIMPTFIIRGYEKRDFFSAVSRAFYLVKGKWWSTFGLVFVLTMIAGVVSYIFLIPYYIVMVTSMLHQTNPQQFGEPSGIMMIATRIFFGLYYLAQILLSTLTHVGITFQYFNLVELKEAKGLMSDIQNFGQAPNPTANRPEEHF